MAEALQRSLAPELPIDIPPYPAATSEQPRGESAFARAFAIVPERSKAFRYLLLLRFTLINLVAFALLGAAYLQGWIGAVFGTDTTYLCHLIAGVFVVGLVLCTIRIVQTSRDLNAAKEFNVFEPMPSRALSYVTAIHGRGADSRMISAQNLRSRLAQRIAPVRQIANSLVVLGLIGTVIGFIISLSGVKPDTASDVAAISPMVATLIYGMSVALYTTLVGAILNIWLMINYRIVATGTALLASTIIELGETHAGT